MKYASLDMIKGDKFVRALTRDSFYYTKFRTLDLKLAARELLDKDIIFVATKDAYGFVQSLHVKTRR